MKFLQLICIENDTTAEQDAVVEHEVLAWVKDTAARGINITGKPLDAPQSAKTVRVRGGETLVSDGPYADTKEFVGGLDLLECENLEEAIEVAAKHPVSWFQAIELRAFPEGVEYPPEIPYGELHYLLQIFADDAPKAPELQDEIMREGEEWRHEANRRGALVFANGVEPTATTVRVRDGEVLLTDGPFAETKEFVAGIALLSSEREEEAIDLAARFPLARHHMVEVRRFVDLGHRDQVA